MRPAFAQQWQLSIRSKNLELSTHFRPGSCGTTHAYSSLGEAVRIEAPLRQAGTGHGTWADADTEPSSVVDGDLGGDADDGAWSVGDCVRSGGAATQHGYV